jgi:hypothetical protein
MAVDSKKGRTSIRDIQTDKAKIAGKSETVKGVGEKLVMDKKQIDATRDFIESLDMPAEDKIRTIAHLDNQQQALNRTFETDVERPPKEQEAELRELAKESSEYAENARKNKEKLGGFRKESGMDDSAIKQAHKEQAGYEAEYRNEQRAIEDDKKSQENDIAELKRRAVGN